MRVRSLHSPYPQDALSADTHGDHRDSFPSYIDNELDVPIHLHRSSLLSPLPSPAFSLRSPALPLPSPTPSEKRRLVSPVMSAVDEQAIPPVPPLPPNFMRKSMGTQHLQARRDEFAEFALGTSPPLARRHSDPPLSASAPPAPSAASDDADAIATITSYTTHAPHAPHAPPPAPDASSSSSSGPGPSAAAAAARSPPPKPPRRRIPPPTHRFDGPVTPPEACFAPRTPPEAACISFDDAPPLPAPLNGMTILPSLSSLSITTPTTPKWFEAGAKLPPGGFEYARSRRSRYSSASLSRLSHEEHEDNTADNTEEDSASSSAGGGRGRQGPAADRGDTMASFSSRRDNRDRPVLDPAHLNVGPVSPASFASPASPASTVAVSPVVGSSISDSVIHKRRSPPSLTSHHTTHSHHSGVSTSTISSLPPTPKTTTSRGASVLYNERNERNKESLAWIAGATVGGRAYSHSLDHPRPTMSMDHGWPSPPQASDDGHVHAHHPCPDLSCSSNGDHEEVMLGSTEMTDAELRELRDMEQFMAEAAAAEDQPLGGEEWVDEPPLGAELAAADEDDDEDVATRDHDPSWTWQKPSARMVARAAQCELYDEHGGVLRFGDLLPGGEPEDADADAEDAADGYATDDGSRLSPVKTNDTAPRSGASAAGRSKTRVNELPKPPRYTKTVVFFVGHWWCGLCHDYVLMSLAKLSPAALLRAGVRVCVISSGTWKAIAKYKEMFRIPPTFAVYVDRGTRLYKALGMRSRIPNPFPEMRLRFRPAYHRHAFLRQMAAGMGNGFFRITGFANPGNFLQLGGEFVFSQGGRCDFAHRMAARSDHCEAPDVLKAVGVEEVSLGAPLKSEDAKVGSEDTKVDIPLGRTAAKEAKDEIEEVADEASPRMSNSSSNEKTAPRPSTPAPAARAVPI